jgi:hypothetical protein
VSKGRGSHGPGAAGVAWPSLGACGLGGPGANLENVESGDAPHTHTKSPTHARHSQWAEVRKDAVECAARGDVISMLCGTAQADL